jgi:hypothetical protein
MPNQQSFLEWMWQNEPWMVPWLCLHFIGMFAILIWLGFKSVNAPPVRTPWVTYIITPIVALILGFYAWFEAPANQNGLVLMIGFCFVGSMLGFLVSIVVHLPKAALWGAVVGLGLSIVFSLVLVPMEIRFGHNPLALEAWKSRLLEWIPTIGLTTFAACLLKMYRLAEGREPSDPPANPHPSG